MSESSSISNDFEYEARAVMQSLVEKVLKYEADFLAPDNLEAVHQGRVSLNKLCAALRNFESLAPKKARGSRVKELKWIKDLLAPIRDSDVTLELVDSLCATDQPNLTNGIGRVREAIQAERESGESVLRSAGETKRYQEAIDGLKKIARKLDTDDKPRKDSDLSGPERLDRTLTKLLNKLFKRYEKRRRRLIDSFEPDVLHQFRIAAKKLRYNLDFFRGSNPDLYKTISEQLHKMHDCTGEMHDIDVLAPKIESIAAHIHLSEGEEGYRTVEPGIEWMMACLHNERRDLMRKFYDIWTEIVSDGFEELKKRATTF